MPNNTTLLHVGDLVPDFALPWVGGDVALPIAAQPLPLSALCARGPVLLFFFRGTWCPNCRKQWAELRPVAAGWERFGVTPLGVVCQRLAALARFRQTTGFPFAMCADVERTVTKAYGVYHLLGIDAINIARPSTFLIRPDRRLAWLWVSRHQVDRPSPAELEGALESSLGAEVKVPAGN